VRFAGLGLANLLRRFDEVRQFCPRVVRRDATTSVTEHVLAILKAHAFSPQAPAVRVLQIVHTNVAEPVGGRLLMSLAPLVRGSFSG
jgi:hypothetical protein